MWLLQEDPDNRILVFTTWTEVLRVLSYALSQNKVSHFVSKGPRQLPEVMRRLRLAVEDVKNSKLGLKKSNDAVRVVLLPFKHGANGLNLTGTAYLS